VIESGLFIAIGLMVVFMKLSWRARLRVLSHPLIMDIGTFVLIVAIHWGTYTGVMAATIAALTCSVLLGIGRKAFGYIERGEYKPGRIDIRSKL
jgi:hypothetical protein